ncbi:hypothetical protein D3C76_815220 [compost metagenome]
MLSAVDGAAVAIVSRSTPVGCAVRRPCRDSSSTPITAGRQAMRHTLQVLLIAMFVFVFQVPSLAGMGRVALVKQVQACALRPSR